MKRIQTLVLVLAGLISGRSTAQCDLFAQLNILTACEAEIQVQGTVSGGVPPYAFVVEVYRTGFGWQMIHQESGDRDGLFWAPIPADAFTFMRQSRMTVTDGAGCTGTASNTYPTIFVGVAAWNWDGFTECATQQVFVKLFFGPLPPPPTYTVDGGAPLSFAADWTQWAPGHFRMNTPWPVGPHTLAFPAYTTTQGHSVCAQARSISGTPAPCAGLRVRAALDGALPGGTTMTDQLRTAGLVPSAYPEVDWPIMPGIPTGVLSITGNDAIVDWVKVEFRSATSPSQVVAYGYGLLQRDGDVVERTGTTGIRLPVPPGNYHVALRHRNHLGVMTAAPIALGADPATTLLDLRSSATATYGTQARVQKGSVLCLWSGDATGNGTLKYTGASNDRDPILTAVGSTTPNNTATNVYDRRDTNLDGVIKYTGTANDRDIILTNVGSTTPNNTRTQQLP